MRHLIDKIQFGNPILRKKAKRLPLRYLKTVAAKKLIKRMFSAIETIGVGLAAPQIGRSISLAVINIHPLPYRSQVTGLRRVLVNPKILAYSKTKEVQYEGCLSFHELRAVPVRSAWVKVAYYDEKGARRVETHHGFAAKVFQHEIDHLNGILFIDRVADPRTIITTREYMKKF